MFNKRLHVAALLLISCMALGLQYNPDEVLGTDPNDLAAIQSGPAGFTPHPPDEVMAGIEWPISQHWFATATVIAPNYIITAAHWKQILKNNCPQWPVNYKLKRYGQGQPDTDYIIVDERHDDQRDIMVCRVIMASPSDPNFMIDADFPKQIALYPKTDEVGKIVTLGSFGKVERHTKPWGECSTDERKQIRPVRGPGTLHWGRNMIAGAALYKKTAPMLIFRYDPIGKGDYIPYETCGNEGNSGAPWFIQDASGQWFLAGLFTSGTAGPRISANRDVIANMIRQMNTLSL
ncbi:MAG: hypothetical protein ABFD91_13445 [Anaerohalosphaeraceae bacterium]